ncbi:DUF2939 domain-containing protein [Bradyrhizobium sp. SUTN9-2]|uniref:DUF2939 domain-containing protein n=1 Tax=Bradyrhizobium sp. SUTN9-2 TaxID=1167456 RepID=UPI001FCEC573|nr:DUF2939 domain-containing protein [Bradyrhizobium sp. SUTN9-2]
MPLNEVVHRPLSAHPSLPDGLYGSAFVSALALVSAVRSGDAVEVIARTDLPHVRHSIVDQVLSAYLDRLEQKWPVRPFERMAINAFGATIADDFAMKLITPENLSEMLKTGTVRNAAENFWNDVIAGRARHLQRDRFRQTGLPDQAR